MWVSALRSAVGGEPTYTPHADGSITWVGEEDSVRMMMRVTMSIEAGNAMIKSGRLPGFMSETLGRLKPEAAYFTADKGDRTAYLFLDVKDQSDLPSLAEPFF